MTQSSTSRPKAVLVIDPRESIRRMYRSALEASGYQVADAESEAVAIAESPTQRLDVVVAEWRTDGGPGAEFLRSLLHEGRGLRGVVAISALEDSRLTRQLSAKGCEIRWVRPYQPFEVVRAVREIVGEARQEQPDP